jgi:hypothetical protein
MCQHNHVIDSNTQLPLPYTCHNAWFETNIHHPNGCHHGSAGTARGSVYPRELSTDPNSGNTLWLEYAVDHKTGYDQLLWLIWYDPAGCPLTVASAVFDRDVVKEMVRRVADFIVIS